MTGFMSFAQQANQQTSESANKTVKASNEEVQPQKVHGKKIEKPLVESKTFKVLPGTKKEGVKNEDQD